MRKGGRLRGLASVVVAIVATVIGFGAFVFGIHSPSSLQRLVQALGLPIFTLLDSFGLLANTPVMWAAVLAGTGVWWAMTFFISGRLHRSQA